jgi:Putative porin
MAKSFKVLGVLALAGLLTAWIQPGAYAADDAKIKLAGFVDELKLSGDLRIREETRWYDAAVEGKGQTNRQRYRLRLAADAKEGPIAVHVRIASGTGEQVSTNQTMCCLSSTGSSTDGGKQNNILWIDKAYVEFKQIPMVVLEGGKMSNPFYMGGSNAVVWDDDYNPEGFAQRFNMNLDDNASVFVNIGEIILDGGGSGSSAQWLMAAQAGTELKTDPGVFKVDVLFYEETKGKDGTFSQKTVQDGNTRVSSTDATLVNSYRVINVNASAKLKIVVPVAITVDFAHNLADTTQTDGSTNANTAYGAGVQVGKAKGPNTAEVGFEYRSIEADAVLADLNDSDFGPNGGTNRKGFKVWTAYGLTDSTTLKLTLFDTKIKDDNLPPAPVTTDETNPSSFRFQADAVVAF